jgi:hypothetical protein
LPHTWSITAGALPPGLSLASSAGAISGTPTTAGASSFTVRVSDNASHSTVQALSITIIDGPNITTSSLPNGAVGAAYSQTVTAADGVQPYQWSIAAGSLPAGCSLNPSTGAISGTPTTVNSYSFTVRVTDSAGGVAARALSITVNAPVAITTTSLPDGRQNVSYSQTVTASGGTTPYSWSMTSGSLPTGLPPINAISGAIAGTPSTSGTFSFTIAVTDAANNTASKALSITIGPIITTPSLPTGTLGAAYSQTVVASGGTTPYTWSLTAGALPAGLSLAPATGVISGTPSASGAFNFTVRATDAAGGTATRPLTITVYSILTVTTLSLPDAQVGSPYSQSVVASGGLSPYAWSLSAGTLPAGLTLDSATGAVAGTPSASGTFNFTLRVTDTLAGTATKALSIAVVVSTDKAPALSVAGGGFTTPNNAFAQDSAYATMTAARTQQYGNFGFSIPAGATIRGIVVTPVGYCNNKSAAFNVSISWNNGTTFTAVKGTANLKGSSDITAPVGGATDTWGRTWSASEFNNASFKLKLTSTGSMNSSNPLKLNYVHVTVYYTP